MTRIALARFYASQRRNALMRHPVTERVIILGCALLAAFIICQFVWGVLQ